MILSVPERSEGAKVFKKHVRDADDLMGAKCEIPPPTGVPSLVAQFRASGPAGVRSLGTGES